MKTYSLYGCSGDKKAFKGTKMFGVIALKSILVFKGFMLSHKMNWVTYLPFPFYITNHKKIKFLKTLSNLDNKAATEMH